MSTLYLSQLKLNINSREVRRDLADPYDMHRTLCNTAKAGTNDLHPFLWRQEVSNPYESPILLVQSSVELDWNGLPKDYLAALATKSWEPEALLVGTHIRFRLVANPTVNKAPPDHVGPARGKRKRYGLWNQADQLAWIERQCKRLGLSDTAAVLTNSKAIRTRRKPGHQITVCTALFDGQGVIADLNALTHGIRFGVGHARMLGLGLMSIAPVRRS